MDAIECNSAAIEHARENARLNGVEPLVEFCTSMPERNARYDIVLANVLNGVLLEHAGGLCERLGGTGRMVLSGLFPTDTPGILARFRPLLPSFRAQVYERGDWRAVMFVP